jgi:peptidoglycan/LPS O-acetylase OafA/YrhL
MDSRKRDAWLDGLRAVAVLLVLGRHAELPEGANGFMAAWHRGGWVGVDLFFVLSGFLVSGLLFREYQQCRALHVPRFLLRRGLRIYPAFYALLGCTALAAMVLPAPKTSIRALVAEACFVQNYCRPIWNHTWSLAVEEHFYVALPLGCLWLLRTRRGAADPFRRLPAMALTIIAVLTIVRCVHGWYVPFHGRSHLFATHLRADSLLAGVLLAHVYHFQRPVFERYVVRWRGVLLIAGIACFVPAFVCELERTWFVYTVGLTLFALGSMLVIAAGLGTAPLPARLLGPIGRDSYSMYLWHMPVLIWGVPWCERLFDYRLADPLRIALYMASSLLVGTIMARAVEWPVLRLRDRWSEKFVDSVPLGSLD